jgi:hypothetical protein
MEVVWNHNQCQALVKTVSGEPLGSVIRVKIRSMTYNISLLVQRENALLKSVLKKLHTIHI